MCGENKAGTSGYSSITGSPPHVRGKLLLLMNWLFAVRITPACAGKTWNNGCAPLNQQDHPRMCGENSMRFSSAFHTVGSPPHVRGKPVIADSTGFNIGITPACAGKTKIPQCVSH